VKTNYLRHRQPTLAAAVSMGAAILLSSIWAMSSASAVGEGIADGSASKSEAVQELAIDKVVPPPRQDGSLVTAFLADPAALDEGKALFRGLCSGCHGGAARGGKGPDLTDNRWLHGHGTDEEITRIIENGVPGTTMKKLGESLKSEQIAKIIAYIQSLARSHGADDWKPYFVGDAAEGEKLFFDPKTQFTCNKCHALNRRGGGIGPALDRVASRRSAQYIMESIVKPSQDIDPRYEQILVATADGKTFSGLRINETNFSVQLREQNGQFHSLNKRDLEQVHTMDTSIMPGNLTELMTVKQLHDLFTFLMTLE
jgi:putative heme-binding domain-containing protein